MYFLREQFFVGIILEIFFLKKHLLKLNFLSRYYTARALHLLLLQEYVHLFIMAQAIAKLRFGNKIYYIFKFYQSFIFIINDPNNFRTCH